MSVIVEKFVLGDFFTNCYLVDNGREALLIDPATPSLKIREHIEGKGLSLSFLLNTHGHMDHIGGNAFFTQHFPQAKTLIHEKDAPYLQDPSLNLSTEFSLPYVSPPAEVVVRGEEECTLKLLGEEVIFLPTPGHTPGSLCLYFPREGYLFSGDTLFAGSVGRVDLPGGSFGDLLLSLEVIFRRFPDHTLIYPGHGPETTIEREKETNFYYLEYLAEKS
ncbi:MAG: MBL fold metallo-hydrolase [Candidatus Caldatribacteriaceae bacterium]